MAAKNPAAPPPAITTRRLLTNPRPRYHNAEDLQSFHPHILIAHDAFGIVGLESERAFVQLALEILAGPGAGRLVVFKHELAVDSHLNLVAFYGDVLRPPFIVLRGRDAKVRDVVDAAGLFVIGVAHIHLAFKAGLGPALVLPFGVEVNAAVRAGLERRQ